MAVDSYGTKGEPEFDDGGAPDTAVDPTKVGEYAGIVGNRIVGTSTERASFTSIWTGFTSPWDGLQFYETDTTLEYKRISGAWRVWESPWISYSATLSGFNVGTGGSARNYTAVRWRAGVPRLKFEFIFGTTGVTFPTSPTVTVPASVLLDAPPYTNMIIGAFAMLDSGTASIDAGRVRFNASDTDKVGLVYANAVLTTANISTTAPWTWAAGDSMSGELDLPVA